MIFTDRTITVRKGESRIDEPIVVYRGDYELEVRFTILNSRFKFMSGTNMIESEKASYGQLAILTPYGGNIFSDIVRCNDGSVTFVLTAEMLNQIEEVGLYSFQIRLMDYNKESRVSIPPIEFGIEVREPIASEDHDNSVNNAIVGYSIAKVVNPEEENISDTFDESGNYNKTKWETGDRISEGKLNKIEDAIDKVNRNEKDNTTTLSKRIDNNFNVLDATKADKNEVFTMANMGQDIKEAMSGGSIAVVGKNTILTENIVDGQVTPDKTSFFNMYDLLSDIVFIDGAAWYEGCLIRYDNWSYSNHDIYLTPNTSYFIGGVTDYHFDLFDSNEQLTRHIAGDYGFTFTTNDNEVRLKVSFLRAEKDRAYVSTCLTPQIDPRYLEEFKKESIITPLSQLEEKVIRPYEIHVSWFKSMEDACEYASSLYPTRVLLNLGVENVVVSSDIEVKLNVSIVGTRAKLRANNGHFRVIKYKGRRISPFEMQPTVQGIDCYEVGFLLGETDDDDAMEFVFRDMKFAYGEFGIKMRHHNYMCSFENIYCRSVQYGIYFDYASISTGGTIRDSGAHLRFTDCTFSDTKSTTDEIDSQAIKLNSGTLDGVSIHFNNCKFVALEQCVKSDSNTPYKNGFFYYNNCHFELNKKTIVSNGSYEHRINNFWMYRDGVGGHVHFSLDGSSKVFLTQGRLDWTDNKLVNSNGGTLHIDLNTVTTPPFLRSDTGNAEAGFADPYTHISVNSKLINTTPITFESTNIVGSLTTAFKVLFKEFGGARTGYREVELNILNKYTNNTDKGFVVELQPGGVSGNEFYIQSEIGNNTLRLVYSTSKIDAYLNGRYMTSLKNPHAVTTRKFLAIRSNTAPSDGENFEIVSCVQKIY